MYLTVKNYILNHLKTPKLTFTKIRHHQMIKMIYKLFSYKIYIFSINHPGKITAQTVNSYCN